MSQRRNCDLAHARALSRANRDRSGLDPHAIVAASSCRRAAPPADRGRIQYRLPLSCRRGGRPALPARRARVAGIGPVRPRPAADPRGRRGAQACDARLFAWGGRCAIRLLHAGLRGGRPPDDKHDESGGDAVPRQEYSGFAKLLHWTIATCVLFMIPAGIIMNRVPGGLLQNSLYTLHRSFGFAGPVPDADPPGLPAR